MQFDYYIDQRIANQVEELKRRKEKPTNQDPNAKNDNDEEEFDGYVPFTDIEHLLDYKQVRVGFEGKYLSEWKGALYYFVIKYNNYPISPVRIQFPKEFRHQYIIQNTGVYCHPDWSEKYWKKSMTLEQIINRVISTFHEIPTYSDYPVDLSFVQLSLNKDEYQQVIKENKNCATQYAIKINEERIYYEQKRRQNEEMRIKKEDEKREKEQRQKQLEDQKKMIEQQKEYQQQINNKAYNQGPQYYDQNQQFNNRIAANQIFNQPNNLMVNQPQQILEVQRLPQNVNQQQQQSFNSGQLYHEQNMQNNSFPGYQKNMPNLQNQFNQQNAQNQQIQQQQQQQMPIQANQQQPLVQGGKIKILGKQEPSK